MIAGRGPRPSRRPARSGSTRVRATSRPVRVQDRRLEGDRRRLAPRGCGARSGPRRWPPRRTRPASSRRCPSAPRAPAPSRRSRRGGRGPPRGTSARTRARARAGRRSRSRRRREVRREVEGEADVAVGPAAELVPVQEHRGVRHRPVDLDRVVAAPGRLGHREALAVPGHAEEGQRALVGADLRVERALDRPVVGQVEDAPAAVVEVGPLRPGERRPSGSASRRRRTRASRPPPASRRRPGPPGTEGEKRDEREREDREGAARSLMTTSGRDSTSALAAPPCGSMPRWTSPRPARSSEPTACTRSAPLARFTTFRIGGTGRPPRRGPLGRRGARRAAPRAGGGRPAHLARRRLERPRRRRRHPRPRRALARRPGRDGRPRPRARGGRRHDERPRAVHGRPRPGRPRRLGGHARHGGRRPPRQRPLPGPALLRGRGLGRGGRARRVGPRDRGRGDGLRLRPEPPAGHGRDRAAGRRSRWSPGRARGAARGRARLARLPQEDAAPRPPERRLRLPEPGPGLGLPASRRAPPRPARSSTGPASRGPRAAGRGSRPSTRTSWSTRAAPPPATWRRSSSRMRDAVAARFGVVLEEEIVRLGEFR